MDDPLKRLVKCIICLALIGTIIALAWYFAVDLPIRQAAALDVPTNLANTWKPVTFSPSM
jgi:hypothetical protein